MAQEIQEESNTLLQAGAAGFTLLPIIGYIAAVSLKNAKKFQDVMDAFFVFSFFELFLLFLTVWIVQFDPTLKKRFNRLNSSFTFSYALSNMIFNLLCVFFFIRNHANLVGPIRCAAHTLSVSTVIASAIWFLSLTYRDKPLFFPTKIKALEDELKSDARFGLKEPLPYAVFVLSTVVGGVLILATLKDDSLSARIPALLFALLSALSSFFYGYKLCAYSSFDSAATAIASDSDEIKGLHRSETEVLRGLVMGYGAWHTTGVVAVGTGMAIDGNKLAASLLGVIFTNHAIAACAAFCFIVYPRKSILNREILAYNAREAEEEAVAGVIVPVFNSH